MVSYEQGEDFAKHTSNKGLLPRINRHSQNSSEKTKEPIRKWAEK